MKTPVYQIMVSFMDSTAANKSIKELEDKVNNAINDGYEPIGGLGVTVGTNNKILLMQAVTLPMRVTQQNIVQNTVVYNKEMPIRKEKLLDLSKVSNSNVV